MRTCPKCFRSAEKYYYIGMSYFWRCPNNKCPVADVEDPNSRKYGFVEPEPEPEPEPEKEKELGCL